MAAIQERTASFMQTQHGPRRSGSGISSSASTSADLLAWAGTSGTSASSSKSSRTSQSFKLGSFPAGVDVDALPLSQRSDGPPKTVTIALAMEAHRVPQREPLCYALQELLVGGSSLVILVCLSKVEDEMGVPHPIDCRQFSGVNQKIVQREVAKALGMVNIFLKEEGFLPVLEGKGVAVQTRIAAGPNRDDSLVLAAKALQPQWLILDKSFSSNCGLYSFLACGGRSFSEREFSLAKRIACNVVLMRGKGKFEAIKLVEKCLGPVPGESLEEPDQPIADFVMSPSSGRQFGMSSSNHGRRDGMSSQSSVKLQAVKATVNNPKSVNLFTCLFLNRKVRDSRDQDGPGKDVTVLFGGTPRFTSDARYLASLERSTDGVLPDRSTPGHSRASSQMSSFGGLLHDPSDTTSKGVSSKRVKEIEARLKTTDTGGSGANYFEVPM